MPYKLTYFPVRGLGEPARYLMIDQGIEFEDDKFDPSTWATIKSKFTFGQVPCLFDGDFQICQSGAIIRHLARKHGLYGDTPEDAAIADMAFEAYKDLQSKYVAIIYGKFETKPEFVKNVLPVQLAGLEKVLNIRGGKGFLLGGDKLVFADYALLEVLRVQQKSTDSKALEAFPVLKAYLDRMEARPKIAAYITSDAHTKMPVNGNANV